MAAFTQMLSSGMFERYPRLRCVVLEAGSNWIAAWLDRLDHKYRVLAHQTPIRMLPSEYFRRQCLISADPTSRSPPRWSSTSAPTTSSGRHTSSG
jgi:hypothetical protein